MLLYKVLIYRLIEHATALFKKRYSYQPMLLYKVLIYRLIEHATALFKKQNKRCRYHYSVLKNLIAMMWNNSRHGACTLLHSPWLLADANHFVVV
jgi:hypothetical protein